MSKRQRPAEEENRPQKRIRQDSQAADVVEIHFARQLQDFLVFRQDGIQQLRSGIASFKAFLESILYHKDEDNRGRQISILREYLDTQKPVDTQDVDRPFLAQLWQAWSFANQNNNDHLTSSVTATLALLLKTLSGILDLREYGILLCRTVLQHQHLRLLKRCLDAPKHKDFILSPSLRLLTEVTSFDGGLLAREVYKRREQTFDISTLRRNLGLVKTDISEDEARRRPAIRTLTLKYVLSLLKYLHEGGKIDILKNRPFCNALFQHIRHDPPEVVTEVLVTVEQNVLKDGDLPRSAKAALLTPQNLERVTEIASMESLSHAASDKAFVWLEAVCSRPEYGILRFSGWYPPGTSQLGVKHDDTIDLGLDSIEFYDRGDSMNVRNPILLSWALTLRAHVNVKERQLLISCFTSAPELVAAYFSEKTMQLDSKLTNTWIGYASLMFEIVNLDIPDHLGGEGDWASLPPQTSIMIENILPAPLTRSVLTRCLNQNSDLITFFAIRILVAATEKLGIVQRHIDARSRAAPEGFWKKAGQRLLHRFVSRSPSMRDVIAVFRKIPIDEDHSLQREATVRLLRSWYEVIPSQALEEQFDISVALTASLTRNENDNSASSPEICATQGVELEHLLSIARFSPGMKWLSKHGSLRHSPLIALLQIHRQDVGNIRLRSLLQVVLCEHGITEARKDPSIPTPFEALTASVLNLSDDSVVWNFLDDCMNRAAKKPVKYIDDLERLVGALKKEQSVKTVRLPSILAAVILEQAPFLVPRDNNEDLTKAAWAQSFLDLLLGTSDAGRVLDHVVENINRIPSWKSQLPTHSRSALLGKVVLAEQRNVNSLSHGSQGDETSDDASKIGFAPPANEPENRPELMRWSQKGLDQAFEDGDIDGLIVCLCSDRPDLRQQGFAELQKVKLKLSTATPLENSMQLSVVIGELLETFEQQYLSGNSALPYVVGTFAIRAMHVQAQPQHFMYPKLSRFLMRGPEWRASRLPTYWLSSTILSSPEQDDSYWREVQWVLDWLVDGLRTVEDMDILRRCSVFEKAAALWSSPGAISHKLIQDRIMELLFRATRTTNGSSTLITRMGILSWLEVISTKGTKTENVSVPALRSRILQTCEKDRVTSWSGGALP